MSAYKSKKSSSEKSFKKETGGYKAKRNFSSGSKKQDGDFSKERDNNDNKPRKRFEKTRYEEKPLKSDKKSSGLVPKIKKSFSDFEQGSKSGSYKKKTSGLSSRPKQSFRDEKSSIERDKKEFGNKDKRSSGGPKKFVTNDKRRPYKKTISKSYGKKKVVTGSGFEGEVRLNRYIAASGMCSRREADQLIMVGEVKLNGKVVTEMGTKVNPGDKVEVGGQSLIPERKVYILLNKPKDFVSTVSDPHAERTVLDLIKHAGPERIYPVGRLDKSTTGVLLLTNDGELTKKLTHPSYNKKKVYHVVLNKPATNAQLQQVADGFELEDGFINVDAISFIMEGNKTEIGIELHSGRNRIVRRIFEHLGFNVEKLDRVYFAGLTKKNLPRGKWRYLDEKEIGMLLQGAYE